MGASLNPDWYSKNIKVGMMLAPVARLDNTGVSALKLMATTPSR